MTIGTNILNQLWNETPQSTWSSLLGGLDEIHARDIITTDQWETLNYAIRQAMENEVDFPDSVGELSVALDPYM